MSQCREFANLKLRIFAILQGYVIVSPKLFLNILMSVTFFDFLILLIEFQRSFVDLRDSKTVWLFFFHDSVLNWHWVTFVARDSVSVCLHWLFVGILGARFASRPMLPWNLVKPRCILCFKAGRVSDDCYFSRCMILQVFIKDSGEDVKLLIYWIGWENLFPICIIELADIVVFFVTLIFIPNFLFHCNHIAQNRKMSQVIGRQEGVCNILRIDQFVGDCVVQQRKSCSWNPCKLLCVGWMQIVWCENWVDVPLLRGRQIVGIEFPLTVMFLHSVMYIDCHFQRFQKGLRVSLWRIVNKFNYVIFSIFVS